MDQIFIQTVLLHFILGLFLVKYQFSSIACPMQVVVSDVPHCNACKYAAEHGIPIVRYPATHESAVQSKEHNAENPGALRDLLLHRHNVDFVILAGYLKVSYPKSSWKYATLTRQTNDCPTHPYSDLDK